MSKPTKSAAAPDGEVIATRTLKVEGRRRPAVVSLYAPQQVAEDEWACAYRITGMRKARRAYGADAIQALTNALQGIRMDLGQADVRYTWIGGEPGNHGFEHRIVTVFGIEFANRMARMVDAETTRFVGREIGHRVLRRRRELGLLK